jgi:FkbM family methyltransferase
VLRQEGVIGISMQRLRAILRRNPAVYELARSLVTRLNITLGQARSAARNVVLRLRGSYSQYGEDLLIDEILGRPPVGMYIDVGACYPRALSNTYRFYRRGWSGINIEPNPARFQAFVTERERDVNLNCAVSSSPGELTFYVLKPHFWTASREFAGSLVRSGYRLVGEHRVPALTLAQVCAEHAGSRAIDLLSVDTDGWDLDVLRSGDWRSFRPKVVVVEANIVGTSQIREFLEPLGYRYFVSTGQPTNALFVEQELYRSARVSRIRPPASGG